MTPDLQKECSLCGWYPGMRNRIPEGRPLIPILGGDGALVCLVCFDNNTFKLGLGLLEVTLPTPTYGSQK